METADQAAILRAVDAPRNLSAIAEGPARVALSWQAPLAAETARITGYGIQFSDDGGASWSVLPTTSWRATSFVHTVGLRPNATLLYRVFAIGTDGAGPAAAATAVLPRTSVPRITAVRLTANQGSVRWYPPRQDVAVTVQFDQAVTVNMTYGTPQIDLVMGRPPHRQSGYASDYSGGSGTDRLTFRYVTGDWNQDLSDIEVAPNALDLNGGRIVNLHATHRASLAHGPATLEVAPQVDTRSDAVLVMDTRAPAPVPAAPGADLQIAQNGQSGSPALAAMLSAAGALVAGTEIVQQLALAEEHEVGQRGSSEQLSGAPGDEGDDSPATVAVDLGTGAGPRAASTSTPSAPYLFPFIEGQSRIRLQWSRGDDLSIIDYLIEVSDDGGQTWTNLLGTDEQGNDLYHPASPPPASIKKEHTGLAPGSTWHYRVTARNSNGLGATSTDESVTTRAMAPVPACAAAFWSTEVTVGSKRVFPHRGYWTETWGSIADDEFSLGGTSHFLHHVYVDDPGRSNPDYHLGVSPDFTEAERGDLTLYVGPLALPLGSNSAHSQQATYHGYRWKSTDYAETFGYPPVAGTSYPYNQFTEYSIGDKVTVCLVDSTPRVSLTLAPTSISENDETSTVTASVSRASTAAFAVTVSAEPDDPAVDSDFTLSTNKVLSFAANATESTGAVTITTVDNDVDTPDKTIQVKGELPGGVPVRAPSDVTLTITDDDATPQLTLSVSPATIAEEGGEATITVSTVDSTFSAEQAITLTFEGTATKGTDYSVAAETLTLGAGERSVFTTVTAIDDSTDENDEAILVTATHDGTTVGTQQQITIADTLAARVSDYSSSVDEGEAALFTVTLSGGTSTASVVVNYEVDSSSTATTGTDYTAPSGKLTITAGESSGTITIATLDTDGVLDPGETLVVKLTSASTDTRTVTVDDTEKLTTTILEQGMVTVSVAAVMVADDALTQDVNEADDKSKVEEGETASFVVSLTGAVSGVVQVPYTTANVTAESGSDKDYTTASGTLEFQAGDTSKTIEVTTLEDSLNEADETFTVTLTGVTGPDGVSLGTSSATGTIEDDDPVSAALGTHTANVAEGDDATYEVDLSGGTSTAPVVVNYAVDTSSTAASGTDYTAPSGKLTIAAEGTSGTITIATLDNDGVLDPGETLVVKLMSASTATRTVTVDDMATATTTILEEDKVTVSVAAVMVADDALTQDVNEADDKSKVEEGETASFVVSLTGAVSGVVQVPYTTANVTAESGSDKDYTTASGTLEFQAGDTSKTIEVTTLEDSLNEADETFTVTLTGVTGPDGVSLGTSSATGTIEDDDPVSAALGTHTANVAEGDDATYEVDLSGGTSTAPVVVNYAVDTSSTAASGTDYTAPSGKLTIAAEGTSGTITIATLDNDGVLDPGETLVVKLMSASTATRTVTVDDTATATTTILEEDMVTVSVAAVMVADDALTQDVNEADDKSKVEEGETASFVVSLTGAVSGVVQVPYTTANVTAESGSDKDYTTASGTLEFQAGDTSKTIEVTTLEDSLNEADETFTVTLTGVTGPDGVSLGTSSATGTIEDDDPVSAALGTHTANVAEGDDATYEVDLSGGTSTAPVVVNYAVDTSSTAASGTDYTAPSGKLTITAGESSGTITIATLDTDGVLDPGETLVVKLMSASTATRTVTVDDTATATTTILEEDKVTVSVAAVMVADDDKSDVEEGETASFVVSLTGAVSGVVQVPYTTANVTAESGSDKDYTTASGTLEFQAGDTSKTIEVTTLEDSLNEADETYTVTLTGVTGPAGVSLGTSSATGTIEDDDPVSAALGTHTANVAEGDDATYEVDLSGGTSTAPVVVNYAVDTSSTAASGTDYTAPSGKLTITAGESSGTITIATLDNDGVLDPGETLVVKLMSASTDTRTVTVDDMATATTTILEEDKVTVSVAAVMVADDDKSDVEEGETASFVVTLSGTVSGVVQVPYTTANVTAESGSDKDYTAASGTLEFSAGDSSKTIEVTTLEDGLNEADETYTLTLTSVTGPDGVSLGTSSATGTIEDDDPVSAALGTYTENVAEGDDATYEVDLSGGTSTAAVVVNYAVDTSSTATSGTDYTAPSGKLTIAAEGTSGTITIATLDNDGVLDPGETLVVKLMSASTATRTVTVDDTATATTTILEEDMVTVSVAAVMVADDALTQDVNEADDKSKVEEGETASFVVSLTGAVSGVVQVPYTTANVTAESGSDKDYTTASGTLEFQAGDTSKTIEVTTLEDSLNEADETFTVTLTSVTGPDGVSLGTSSATGTIEDDDPVSAALGTHTANVAEGDDATYEVDLSGGTSTAPVVVNYAVDTSSTAASGTDYTAPSGKLTITAGESSGTITIATLDNDGVLDPGETLVVKLMSASTDTRTVTVDDTATATTTILEEDKVTVSVAAVMVADDDKSDVEEGETASFVVTLSGTVSGVVQVPYTTANVTAESGSDKDYTTTSGTLEFQAGDTSKTIEVTTLEDSLNEADETFTVTLTGVTGPAGVSLGTSSATGTIEDDDPVSAALGTHTANVAEGDDATYEVNLTGGTSTAEVVVNYAVDTSSTATTGTDYTAPSGKLTIAAEGTSGTITIVTLDNDGVLDPGETLVVKLMSASTDTRTVTVDDTEKLTTTILEQDMVTVSVAAVMVADDPLTQDVNEADDKSDVEEGETASFVVALTGAVSGVVQVPYTTANGTAESGSDKDYTAASGTLEFQAGDSSKTIEVTTLEDGLNEADETYTLTLTSVTGPDGVSLGTSSATGTIEDDDPVSAALGTYTEEVAEGDDATYEVNLTGGTSTAEVVVNYAMDTSSTATTGTDYTAPSGKLTIAAEGTSGTITIVTLDNDGVLDPGETLVVKLMSASTDTRTVTVDDTATATTTILEEDKVTVSVADDDKSDVEEGETASFVVTLSGTVSGVVQVPYTTANVTAESGSDKDYTAASGTLEFQAGDSSKTIEVTTLEDGLNEADETYTLTLTSVTGPDGVSLGTSSATGTIEDDDPVSAALGTHTANVAEGDDATYEVDLSGGTSTAPVVVNYAVDTSSTAASGTDYTAPSGKLTITAGESSGTITIATLDNDGVLDPGETLVVKLMSASTDTRTVTVDDTATATTTILEEDKVTVSVADDDKSDVEEGETASFVVTLSGTVSGVVQVPYTTANVTAESGSDKDYTTTSGTLEFQAGDTSKTIEVTTLEDSLNEADETYTLTLTSVTGPDGVSLGTSSATGTIEDDDPVSAALGTYTEEVAEGDDATYEVNLTGGTSTAEVVVNYAMDTSSTATTGTDYTAPSGKLTITAGESSGTITIATLDNDGVLDPGETLVVKLMSASTDTRTVTVDDTATKTTMINDTGSVMVSLKAHTTGVEDSETKSNVQEGHSVKSEDSVEEDQEATSVEEGDTAEFIVELSGLVASTVTVTYGTADGTAESGTNKDYTEASGTLEFQAGDTSKTIEVTTLEDGLNEADETYTLTLTSVTGPDGVSLGTSSATGTIEDDDPVSAALGTYTEEVAEGDDATYEVNLTGGTSTAEVVVNYAVDGSSTATSGTDYTAPSGKLTIAAEGTSGTITIATLDNDGVLDPGETLVVNLTSASTDTRTVTVDDTATTTTILEEDMVTVSLAAVMVAGDDKSEVEEGETANFVVTLSGTVSGVVQVPYTTTNVTAESGSDKDYTAASGTLEFQAGDTSKTIEVTTLEDSLNEAAETFTLTLTSVTGPDGVSLGTSSATGTIEDDDPISAALGTTYTENVAEGDDATYEVTLSGGTSTAEVVVNYAMDGSSTATSGTDYTAPSGTLTIAAEGTSGTITIATLDNDGVLDPGETLVVKLTSASTATRTVAVDDTATKTTTITDSGMVKVSVEDATASEGDAVGFVVELTGPVAGAVELSYATGDADDTADSGAGNDYTAATGTLEFSAGDTSQTIAVTTLEDVVDEENETFTLTLTASNLPSGVSLDDAEATGTITDDDTVPGVPTGVSAKGANRQVTLQWSAPSSPGTSPITGYEYRSKSGTDDYPATWESAGGATATSTTVSNLANDIQHTFALRAVSDAGDGKAVEITATPFWANVVPTFTSTATPSVAENVKLAVTLQATDDDGDAVVGFAITGGADSDMFAIDDSGGLLFETAPNFEDPKDVASTDPVNAADNSEYVVVVTVTSGAGDRAQTAEQTITVTVTDADEPPLAPGKPEVDTVSITSLRARWLAPTNTGPPITDYDYRYRIKTPQGEWATFENTPITVLEQAITDLQENTEYQVQVRANNEEGEGAWSESGEGETEANAAPHFTSSAAFEIAENSTAAVGGVTADDTDTEDDVEAYAIVGGADKLLFAIDVNGALSFKSAPNHEAPQDELSTTPPNDAGNNE